VDRPDCTDLQGCTDRLACIDLKAFPLQLLLRREPQWAGGPIAVVEEDKPLARILWLNEHARACGILPGMRYSAGLALAADLCAGVVSQKEIAQGVEQITGLLRDFGPEVEPHEEEPGMFWLGARGLDLLFPSQQKWASRIREQLKRENLWAAVVVGFDRFATYALVRSLRDSRAWVLKTLEEEGEYVKGVRLDRLHLPPNARDALQALGVMTLGDLIQLPPDGLRDRFGKEAHALHQAARGQKHIPVQATEPEEPLREGIYLEESERDIGRLMFGIKRLLDPILQKLAERRQALAMLLLELRLERGARQKEPTVHMEQLRPAEPTLDAGQLMDLVLLRLESLRLRAGVTELAVSAQGIRATQRQLDLFAERPKRDPIAQKRVFAKLRAEFGDQAVVHAGLREGHLPEGSFCWKPLEALPPKPKPRLTRRTLIRRMRAAPYALPHRPRHEEDGWQLRGRDDACVDQLQGPFVLSGGWRRVEQHRTYYLAPTRKDEWLWVFRDTKRRRWYLHGRVE